MFYFKITVRTRAGEGPRLSRNTFHEFTRPSYVGDHVAGQLTRPDVTSIGVTRITQAAYLKRAG